MTQTNCVMLCRNRPELTQQAIVTMFDHAPPASFTLTIVDDGSDEKTRLLLEQFARTMGKPWTVVIRLYPPSGIVGLCRNLGILASERIFGRGEFLYLSDSDAYFLPGWLDTLTAAWPQAEELGFKILGLNGHPYHGINESFSLGDGRVGELRSHDAVHGLSHSMRWETWDAYQPYDAHAQGTGQSEDWAMCRKVVNAGYKVGTLWPYLVANCGVMDSFGKPTPGADAVRAQTEEFMVCHNLQGKVVVE